jgi:hypothetical protein
MNRSLHENLPDVHANSLLALTFGDPAQVLADRLLSPDEKRCILAAWASDAFAVEDRPWLRQLPGSDEAIPVAAILRALQRLDEEGDPPPRRGGAALNFPQCEETKLAVGF